MGIFDDIKAKGATYRLTEEALYAEALREIESGQRRDGIWAKAMSESDMDQGKAGAKYIKLRVQSLKDEVTVFIAELNRTPKTTETHEEIGVQAKIAAPRLGRAGKAWAMFLIGVSGLMLFVALPVSFYQGDFKWSYLVAVAFWGYVFYTAYSRLFHKND